jgi:protein-S-isoprenylcysteine O-methyltransferase Ste14
MLDSFFKGSYLIGLIAGSVVRTWYGKKYKQSRIKGGYKEGPAVWLLMSLWGVAQIMGLLYVLTSWLDFADYQLPIWAGCGGVAIFAVALWLLWRSHADLSRNWSPTLEIRQGHSLITHGVYRTIRHPMYLAHWLWSIAQALLLQNWIAGLAGLVVFVPLYLLRVPREEQMMLEQFGQEYRLYMNRTGRVIPRFQK